MSAVLTFGPGDLGNLLALVVGPKGAGNPLALVVGPKAAGEISANASQRMCVAGPGALCSVLVLQFVLPPPGGALRPGLVPAGWGALGRCLLARFGGKTAPPLVH